MKSDLYTKAVLTVIAFMLVMIGCRDYVNPRISVKAEGPFAGVQFSGGAGGFTIFDPRTGDIWQYYSNNGMSVPSMEHTRISAPGIPASAVQWRKEQQGQAN
jgi:hypothetical protein